jgi:hypothetical protein
MLTAISVHSQCYKGRSELLLPDLPILLMLQQHEGSRAGRSVKTRPASESGIGISMSLIDFVVVVSSISYRAMR